MAPGLIDTVFLDRDGTINTRLVGEWIVRPEQFELLPGAGEALSMLRRAGMRLIVVTNQRGIELGLFTEHDLARVHARMSELLAPFGVALDAVYYSPTGTGARAKPAPGMLLDAQRDFPAIAFERSVMIGDAARDVQAGAAAGCRTVLLAAGEHGAEAMRETRLNDIRTDFICPTLRDAAEIVLGLSRGSGA